MKNLEKRLEAWVSVSLISEQQAEAIRRYEIEQPSSRWILYGLLSLGIFILAMGIISLIAANWDSIPAWVKLTADFVLLILSGYFVIYSHHRREMMREGSILGFILLILASIGLISQVYQAGGELPDALMLWGLITLPLILNARHFLTAAFWCALVIPSLYYQGMDAAFLSTLLSPTEQNLGVMALMPVFLGTTYLASCVFKTHRSFRLSLQLSLFISFLISLWVADINVTFPDIFRLTWQHPLIWYLGGAGLLVGLVGILFVRTLSPTQKSLLSIAVISNAILYALVFEPTGWRILGAVIAIIGVLMLMLYFGSRRDVMFYHLTALLIGFRFLLLYVTELGGLVLTGLGLIATGVVIISMVWLWNRHQSKLAHWLGERSI